MPTRLDYLLNYLGVAVALAICAYSIVLYIRAWRTRPRFEKSEVLYQEYFASGCSHKNILIRIGGARNCLRLVVTRNFLWVTSWFPFSMFTPLCDLEHVIPLGSIVKVRRESSWWMSNVILTYRDDDRDEHTLRLRPKNMNDFIGSLGVKTPNEMSNQLP